MKKLPTITILIIGWLLTLVFGYLAYITTSDKWSNIFSDAFGTALSIVLLTTLTIIVLKIRKII